MASGTTSYSLDEVGNLISIKVLRAPGGGGRERLTSAAITEAIRPCTPPGAFGARHWPTRSTSAIIVVDRTATDWICRVLPDDLERLRQGRADAVRYQTKTLLPSLSAKEQAVLARVYVKVVDVDAPEDPDAKWAITALQDFLVDGAQADLAWRLLCNDALEICNRNIPD